MSKTILMLLMLIGATLACTLTGEDDEPTPVPINQNPIPQFPTATATVLLPSPTATTTPASSASNPLPNCTPRTDWFTYVIQTGDTLGDIAARTNSTVDALVTANCLANANVLVAGQILRVPRQPVPRVTNTATLTSCTYTWFFTFSAGKFDSACPAASFTDTAIGQDFEGGRVLRYPNPPNPIDNRGTLYVIYNDGFWLTYPDAWDGSPLPNDPTIVPPANRYAPTDSIGYLWHKVPEVRAALGWAYEPAALFVGTIQAPASVNSNYWYMDHGKNGIVLKLTSLDMQPNPWEVAGSR